MTPPASSKGTPAQPMRSDAERNRARIIAAGREVFGDSGLSASMASVAREAGVGIATILRHFPVKENLVEAVFLDRMSAYADAVRRALQDPDPWHGFVSYIETACAMQAADSGFADILTVALPGAKALEQLRNEAYADMLRLIEAAKGTGSLRADFDSSDLVLMHMANAGVISAAGDAAADASRRLTALMIQSLQTPARGPLPPSPAHEKLYKAMIYTSQTTAPPSE